MLLPIRLTRGRWPTFVESTLDRFAWSDPRVILTEEVSAEDFSTAMSAFAVGGTIKITGGDRHALSDALLLKHVELSGVSIVDVGASDGSTSLRLISRLPSFASYVISDLHLNVTVVETADRAFFYDHRGDCFLVVGPRFLAWPQTSKLVELLYRWRIRSAAGRSIGSREVLLINPAVQSLLGTDPRVTVEVRDVFEPWEGPRPDVIKVANLLRRLYFRDDEIQRALNSLHDNLDEGGYLLLVDNPRIAGIVERGGLYRRAGDGFTVVEETPDMPEIADLVRLARSSQAATAD